MYAARQRHSIPTPVVDSGKIQAASNSAQTLSRARYRALISKGIVSPGFTVAIRGATRLRGSRKYHSVLAMLAIKAELAGDDEGASYLGGAATKIEERFKERIADYLRSHPIAALPAADFFEDLSEATSDALARWRRLRDVVFADGEVSGIDNDDVRIAGTTSAGQSVEVLLPAVLATSQEIGIGDSVWVFRTLAGATAVIEIVPAVQYEDDHDDDGGRYYLEQGAGAPITPEEAAYFQGLAKDSLPVAKVVRPAG